MPGNGLMHFYFIEDLLPFLFIHFMLIFISYILCCIHYFYLHCVDHVAYITDTHLRTKVIIDLHFSLGRKGKTSGSH